MFINNLVTKQQGVITMSFQLSKTYRPERQLITENYRLDEKTAVDNLLKTLDLPKNKKNALLTMRSNLLTNFAILNKNNMAQMP